MRSAYGRQTPPPDYELTCVEPGSPMGKLLRRYWQPVCTSDELCDLPKKLKLLCEELVVFRDKKGRVGALEPHCSHRGTSLEWGRVEEEGLRCCYHGWLYDTEGQCIDMPCETKEFRKRMDVWHPALTTDWPRDFGLPADMIKGGMCIGGMYDLTPVRLSARSKYVEFDDAMVAAPKHEPGM